MSISQVHRQWAGESFEFLAYLVGRPSSGTHGSCQCHDRMPPPLCFRSSNAKPSDGTLDRHFLAAKHWDRGNQEILGEWKLELNHPEKR
jgi:hypothetical protein